jgi:putative methyltransferase
MLNQKIIFQKKIQTDKRLKISFVNPPHADWSLCNNMTFLMCQTHYNIFGKYKENVDWIKAPYKWNTYKSVMEVFQELSECDIIMFSSYAWNYGINDDLAKYIKQNFPQKICVLGGPHIGTNEPKFLQSRKFYDFICQPTKPGEPFIEDLIDSWFENNGKPKVEDICWELKSCKQKKHDIDSEISVYEEHLDYLKEMLQYAKSNKMEPFIVLETTRGCPYGCVFCEWGGGIGTKIIKKSVDLVKRDIMALKKAGFRDAYLTDANFGAFKDRDIEIFKFAWENNFNLTDISTVKIKNLERRKQLIDAWFDVVGKGPEKHSKSEGGTDMWGETEYISVVPTVSIQSISEEAMKVADRTDLCTKDKIELSRYIKERCENEGYPVPAIELILGMPGSTIEDFYSEMEIIWNFQAWSSFRHDYMFLPDSKLNSKEYREKYKIKTVEVFSDIVDEDGIDNWNSLYKNKKTYFKTMQSCYSYTKEEMHEMWFMNNAGNFLLKNIYPSLQSYIDPKNFGKKCFKIISKLDDFENIHKEIIDIFDENTEPKSIRKLQGKFRTEVIEDMLKKNEIIIKNEIMKKVL